MTVSATGDTKYKKGRQDLWKCFEIPDLLSCEPGNSVENEAWAQDCQIVRFCYENFLTLF